MFSRVVATLDTPLAADTLPRSSTRRKAQAPAMRGDGRRSMAVQRTKNDLDS